MVRLVNFKPGRYRIKVRVDFRLLQDPGNVSAALKVLHADGKGGLKEVSGSPGELWCTANTRGKRKYEDTFSKELTLELKKRGNLTLLVVKPTLAGRRGCAKAAIQVRVIDIKFLGR
jgi:hypothetical protein